MASPILSSPPGKWSIQAGSLQPTVSNGVNIPANTSVGNLIIPTGSDIRPITNSTTAINIAQADGTNFVTFDTTNKKVGIGVTPTEALHVKSTGTTGVLVNSSAAGGGTTYLYGGNANAQFQFLD